VHSDPRLLRRILQNFIANALRYTASGRVLVAARCRGAQIELQVWDTGPGIPSAQQASIFSDLPGSDGGSSPWGERGLGIGLSGCRRMADALGHPLGLRSRPGRGSCFSVSVPRWRGGSTEPGASAEVNSTTLAGRILLIDNDPAVLDGFRLLLTRWGHRVESGSSIDDALKLLPRGPYTLALIDFSLDHRGNGLQIIAALRQRDPGLPCVLVTADRDPDLPARARAIGALMAAKPLKPAALRALLRQQRVIDAAPGSS
jgi:CheY-like chemotaxis protein/anti-sigma regulatory factor (Ser/Thr protein kinase)